MVLFCLSYEEMDKGTEEYVLKEKNSYNDIKMNIHYLSGMLSIDNQHLKTITVAISFGL